MKARELIVRLSELLDERPELATAEVTTEGCDCDGDVGTVSVLEYKARHKKPVYVVYLERS